MKIIICTISIVVAFIITFCSLKEEAEESKYVIDSRKFLIPWATDNTYRNECDKESKIKHGKNAVNARQIKELIDKALLTCELEGRVNIPMRVGATLAEAAYVPYKIAIPAELAKQALQAEKRKRCSDYIQPLLAACPGLLEQYFENVK